MRKLFTLVTLFAFIASCSSSEKETPIPDPVTPPVVANPNPDPVPPVPTKINVQYKVTGTSKLVSIYFVNASCKRDSVLNTTLPYILTLDDVKCDSTGLVVRNEKVNGGVSLELWVDGKLSVSSGSNNPRSTSQIIYLPKTKKASKSVYNPEEWGCGVYKGHNLITGPKGGCYYINSNGNKTYVERSYCNCD